MGLCLIGIMVMLGSIGAASQATNEMPRAFSKLRLGMSESEVRELRPDAAAFDIFGEPEQTTEDAPSLLIEFLNDDPFFDTVDFTFVQDRLCIVKWARIKQGSDFSAMRSRVLQGAIRKWGDGFERIVQPWQLPESNEDDEAPPSKSSDPLPGIRWSADGTDILVSYTPSEGASPDKAGNAVPVALPDLIQLSIFQRSCLGAMLEKIDRRIEVAGDDLPQDFFRDLKAQASGVLFE